MSESGHTDGALVTVLFLLCGRSSDRFLLYAFLLVYNNSEVCIAITSVYRCFDPAGFVYKN